MNRALYVLATLSFAAAVADAATLKAYNGDVTFNHVAHRKKFGCSDCHEGPPRYFELTRDSAHRLCLGCHRKVNAGPVRHCSDCHKIE